MNVFFRRRCTLIYDRGEITPVVKYEGIFVMKNFNKQLPCGVKEMKFEVEKSNCIGGNCRGILSLEEPDLSIVLQKVIFIRWSKRISWLI